jgi:hypothetical protein
MPELTPEPDYITSGENQKKKYKYMLEYESATCNLFLIENHSKLRL